MAVDPKQFLARFRIANAKCFVAVGVQYALAIGKKGGAVYWVGFHAERCLRTEFVATLKQKNRPENAENSANESLAGFVVGKWLGFHAPLQRTVRAMPDHTLERRHEASRRRGLMRFLLDLLPARRQTAGTSTRARPFAEDTGVSEQTTNEHPAFEQLAAFDQGKLRTGPWTVIARHILECDACCQKLETVPDDELVQFVRAVVNGFTGLSSPQRAVTW